MTAPVNMDMISRDIDSILSDIRSSLDFTDTKGSPIDSSVKQTTGNGSDLQAITNALRQERSS